MRATSGAAMAKKLDAMRRKLVQFDEETWRALDLLRRDQMKSFEEISNEAFRDLLRKYGQPENLKAALKESARVTDHPSSQSTARKPPAGNRKSPRSPRRKT
jgi:hypothetical protein